MAAVFSEIIGHELQVQYLAKVLAAQKCAPAYIFSGPRGVGKNTIAEEFALALLGISKDSSMTTAQQLAAQPDFIRLSRPTEETEGGRLRDIPVEEVKTLCQRLTLTAVSGIKVAIIDEADGLNFFGQNALLKTLEEPAGKMVVILITEDVEALLPTLRSRTVPLVFSRISTALLETSLKARGVAAALAKEAAERSLGRPGISLSLTEGDRLAQLKIEEERIQTFIKAPLHERLGLAQEFSKEGGERDREAWFEELAYVVRRDLAHAPAKQAEAMTSLLEARDNLAKNANTALALEHIALSL